MMCVSLALEFLQNTGECLQVQTCFQGFKGKKLPLVMLQSLVPL